MSSTQVACTIPAEPVSVALLLADPATVTLWPGVERSSGTGAGADASGRLRLEVGDSTADLHLPPPSRRDREAAFVLGFDVDGAAVAHVVGRLALRKSTAASGHTDVELEVTGPLDLTEQARTFLARVAAAAQARSTAA